MVKIISAIVACVFAVIFVIQNSEHVDFYLFVGGPIRIRLIFLFLTAFALGYVTSYLLRLGKENGLKNQIRSLKNRKMSPIDDQDGRPLAEMREWQRGRWARKTEA